MNVGKSIKIALAQQEKNTRWLSEKMGVQLPQVSKLAVSKHANGSTIDKISEAFEMSSSEFIALGEKDYESK